MKVNSITIIYMVKVELLIQMETLMKEISSKIKDMEREYINLQMVEVMTANFLKISFTAKAHFNGKMGINI